MTLEEKASLMSGANFWNTKPVTRLISFNAQPTPLISKIFFPWTCAITCTNSVVLEYSPFWGQKIPDFLC